MLGIEGLYTAINALIRQMEDDGCAAIDCSDIVKLLKGEIDVHSVPTERFINFALRAAVGCGLYQNNYRSVVRGEGLFVNLNTCSKPEYLARLFNNAKLSERQKTQAVSFIMKQIKSEIPGQLSFDFETGDCVEDITKEQLVEMLKADAHAHSITMEVTKEMREKASAANSKNDAI